MNQVIDEVIVVSSLVTPPLTFRSGEPYITLRVVASTQPLRCGLEFNVVNGTRGMQTLRAVMEADTDAHAIRCKWSEFADKRTGEIRQCPVFFAGLPVRST